MNDNVKINSSLMYDFNPHFDEIKNNVKSLTYYKLKIVLPDYIYENFFLMDEENKNILISFLNIFMQVIINKLNQILSVSEKIYLPKKTHHFRFESKLDILNFFKEKLNVYPVFTADKNKEYYREENRFLLGKNSNLSIKNSRLGNKIESATKNIYLYINITRDNLTIFVDFIKKYCPKFSIIINQDSFKKFIEKRYYFIINTTNFVNIFCA